MQDEYHQTIRRIIASDPRYDASAYYFMNDAVSFTIRKLDRIRKPRGQQHVSGPELIRGLLDLAKEQFGFLAPEVFEYWGIQDGLDAGYIVFNMIHAGLLSASQDDSLQAFDCLYHLPELLRQELFGNDLPATPEKLEDRNQKNQDLTGDLPSSSTEKNGRSEESS